MKKSLQVGLLLAAVILNNVFAGEFIQIEKHLKDEIVDTQTNGHIENGFHYKNITKANLSCGLAPLPPLGCSIGSCVCDQNGNNCHWQFICQ